jgi:hypothetical protein
MALATGAPGEIRNMDEKFLDIINTARKTVVLRQPRNVLSTFGTTRIHYFLLTDPIYQGLIDKSDDTILREGYVHAEKPRIITPFYLKNIFDGFEHGNEYSQSLIDAFGPFEPGILYNYRNDFKDMTVITTPLQDTFERINDDLEKEDDPFSAIIKGDGRLWDVSLMIFIYSLTGRSVASNLSELHSLGLLAIDRSGVSQESRLHIESLFREVETGKADPALLKRELDAWGIFPEYEDRFLNCFKKKPKEG